MTYRIEISPTAMADVETIFLWLKDYSIDEAHRWVRGCYEIMLTLASHLMDAELFTLSVLRMNLQTDNELGTYGSDRAVLNFRHPQIDELCLRVFQLIACPETGQRLISLSRQHPFG